MHGIANIAEGEEVDVTPSRNGLFRVPVLIPGGLQPPPSVPVFYPVVVNIFGRSFSGAGAPITDVAGPPGGIVITPEPASGALLIALTTPLLRRRR